MQSPRCADSTMTEGDCRGRIVPVAEDSFVTSTESKYRALVVDDEPMVLQATARALRRAGFECDEASNGSVAWEKAQRNQFDAVVTDLRMPVANGHQLAVQLLELPKRPTIVVFTGVVEPRLANDLKIRGIEEILFKPMKYELLANRIRTLVEHRLIAAPPQADAALSCSVIPPTKSDAKQPMQRAPQQASAAAEKAMSIKGQRAGIARRSTKPLTQLNQRKLRESRPGFLKQITGVIEAMMHNRAVRTGLIFSAGALVGSLVAWAAFG